MLKEAVDYLRQYIYRRQYAYQKTFDGPLAAEVLADLMNFCRAQESTFHENPHISDRLDGRREVWLRIQNHLHLTQDELFEISTGDSGKQTFMVQSRDESD